LKYGKRESPVKSQPAASTSPAILSLVGIGLVCAAAWLVPAAAAQGNGGTHVVARCAGDILSGTVRVGRDAPSGQIQLAVLAKHGDRSGFTATGMDTWLDVVGGRSYPFRFDIGRLSATAYRVDPPGDHSNVVPAPSCAPGHQVPEAPLSLMLPLSVLGLGAVLFGRNRRLRAER
jgi:hypothetical protein